MNCSLSVGDIHSPKRGQRGPCQIHGWIQLSPAFLGPRNLIGRIEWGLKAGKLQFSHEIVNRGPSPYCPNPLSMLTLRRPLTPGHA